MTLRKATSDQMNNTTSLAHEYSLNLSHASTVFTQIEDEAFPTIKMVQKAPHLALPYKVEQGCYSFDSSSEPRSGIVRPTITYCPPSLCFFSAASAPLLPHLPYCQASLGSQLLRSLSCMEHIETTSPAEPLNSANPADKD